MPCGEKLEVPFDGHFLRRFRDSDNHRVWDYDKKAWVPSPEALQFDPDLSGSWNEHLKESHGLGPASVASDGYPLVGEWLVSDIRALDFEVEHTPQGSLPIECAHTSVWWPISALKQGKTEPDKPTRRRLRSVLAGDMSWAHGEISAKPPDA